MVRLLHELETGLLINPETVTLSDYLREWFETVKSNLSPKSQVRYQSIVNRVSEHIGRLELQKLKPAHIQQMYNRLVTDRRDGRDKPLSPATVLYHHRVLHKALETAVKWQLIPRNSANAVEAPKQQKKEAPALDAEHVKILLNRVQDTPYYTLVIVAVMTGMRRGELLALRWEDIDFDNRKIYVRRTIQYIPDTGIIFKEPKTAGSRRSISIPPAVIDALKNHRKEQAEIKLKYGEHYHNNQLVFCQYNGQPMHPDTISSWFPKYCVSIDLPRVNFHSLRHTCASLLLKQGVHSKIVADILGHSSTRITDDIYSHVLPGVQEEALLKLDCLVGHQMGTKT